MKKPKKHETGSSHHKSGRWSTLALANQSEKIIETSIINSSLKKSPKKSVIGIRVPASKRYLTGKSWALNIINVSLRVVINPKFKQIGSKKLNHGKVCFENG